MLWCSILRSEIDISIFFLIRLALCGVSWKTCKNIFLKAKVKNHKKPCCCWKVAKKKVELKKEVERKRGSRFFFRRLKGRRLRVCYDKIKRASACCLKCLEKPTVDLKPCSVRLYVVFEKQVAQREEREFLLFNFIADKL